MGGETICGTGHSLSRVVNGAGCRTGAAHKRVRAAGASAEPTGRAEDEVSSVGVVLGSGLQRFAVEIGYARRRWLASTAVGARSVFLTRASAPQERHLSRDAQSATAVGREY